MTTPDAHNLVEELEQFHREKEKIRGLIGQIGGKNQNKRETSITIGFLVAVVILFVLDILREVLDISIPLPPLFSIQLGVLLVSGKIIWMIHKQTRVEHFQFWILNSIEFRLDEMSRRIKRIEKEVIKDGKGKKDA